MRSRKALVAAIVLLALVVPYAAMAGQAPSSQVGKPLTGDVGNVTGYQDTRGRTAYGGVLFWYQYFSLFRWISHYGHTF
ncbi:MAG: hypothetical protein EHM19_11370 [Candidatus Latescibacterota bacterium]|nr:MAG: hypothetical protein EHM19_11370 [Candidatus Latescibacterota bacterium]